MDKLVRPRENQCTVLSFGINHDESFDLQMNEKYGCHVHSFDPDVETQRFGQARIRLNQLGDLSAASKPGLEVNEKWHFYSVGLTGVAEPLKDEKRDEKKKKLMTIEQIYDLTGTRNKVIDIWKMDIEGYERAVFEKLDMDYVCKYVKQFMFETHWVC
jgi:FkbM family methyltransferase